MTKGKRGFGDKNGKGRRGDDGEHALFFLRRASATIEDQGEGGGGVGKYKDWPVQPTINLM